MTDTNGQPEPARATDQDYMIEQLPTAMPGDKRAGHENDPNFVPTPGFEEGLEVTS